MPSLMSQTFVKRHLKAPASANFCELPEPPASYDAVTHHYTVRCWVDAQNSFGAMLRTQYTAVLHQADPAGNHWQLVDLKIE